MIIEVKGVQFVNKGAELMLVAIQQAMEKEYGNSFHIALSPRNSPYEKRAKYQALQKIGNLNKRIDWSYFDKAIPNALCKAYGLAKHEDIDVALDASGFAYGDQWTSAMLAHSVRQAKLMKERGAHYIFMPQAMGPFSSDKYKKLVKEAADSASLMFIRDPMSYKYVTEITGERENVILSPDFTNLVNPNYADNNQEKIFTIIPNGKMLGKQNKNNFNGRDYLNEFVQAGLYAQSKGYHVNVLNHEGKGDLRICKNIFSSLSSDKATLIDDLSALEVKEKINCSEIVLCSRFHGCVSSLAQNIPVIATSWSHKYEMLYADYNVTDLVYKFDKDLVGQVSKVIHDYDKYKRTIAESSRVQKEKVRDMWSGIFSLLKN